VSSRYFQQDRDLPTKIRSIPEYNKLQGRQHDKSKMTVVSGCGMDGVASVSATAPVITSSARGSYHEIV
jgi:hypothetical protein